MNKKNENYFMMEGMKISKTTLKFMPEFTKKNIREIKKNYISEMHPALEVRENSIEGQGVFSKREIKKGEVLVVFKGYMISRKEIELLNEVDLNYITQFDENLFMFSPIREPGDFFNHSCSPNAGFSQMEKYGLVAMRDIKKDEEVTYDYSIEGNYPDETWKCLCGNYNCRKYIKPDDWKITYKKYKGYLSPYIKKLVKKLPNNN
ncbi:MAG: SET domain-containing protein-lysine N-methyltransferase [Leptospiraceae bacterium]|nr:SET domain-containing protein-lysine N-methyltransferase [Leptospiraceae bacterium]MCP5497053.1 SET domain-containing protein-lysine N-methyltransferase [Leptospiraceae bacterium]